MIEDCAQAHGASPWRTQGRQLGLAGCFSFYPTKNCDGGAVTAEDAAFAARLRELRQYGWAASTGSAAPAGEADA